MKEQSPDEAGNLSSQTCAQAIGQEIDQLVQYAIKKQKAVTHKNFGI